MKSVAFNFSTKIHHAFGLLLIETVTKNFKNLVTLNEKQLNCSSCLASWNIFCLTTVLTSFYVFSVKELDTTRAG